MILIGEKKMAKAKVVKVKKLSFQGDVAFMRIDEMPTGVELKRAEPRIDGQVIVAHSETGHHHVMKGAEFFETSDPFVCYLRLEGPSALISHERSFDTHAPQSLEGGKGAVWKVIRQREMTPEGWKRVED